MEATSSGPKGHQRVRTDRDLRAERAAALARRGAAAGESETGVDHLVCACGSERYGLPVTAVAQILPMCRPSSGSSPSRAGLSGCSAWRARSDARTPRPIRRPTGGTWSCCGARCPTHSPITKALSSRSPSRSTGCSASSAPPDLPRRRGSRIPTDWATRPLRVMPPGQRATAVPTSSSSTSPAFCAASCPDGRCFNRSHPRP
jgi:hypothetical protein